MIEKEVMSYVFEGKRLEHRIERGLNYLVYQNLKDGKYLNDDVEMINYLIEQKKKVVALAKQTRSWSSIGQPYMEHYYADISFTDAFVNDDKKLQFNTLHLYMEVQYNKLTRKTFLRISEGNYVAYEGPFSFSSTDVIVMRKEALAYANNELDLDIFYEI